MCLCHMKEIKTDNNTVRRRERKREIETNKPKKPAFRQKTALRGFTG